MEVLEDVSDLGVELWALVWHLYKKNPHRAFEELCLRTGEPSAAETDVPLSFSVSRIKKTKWYESLTQRYQSLCDKLKRTHGEYYVEAEEAIEVLYPKGCSISQYAEAINSCVSLMTYTIPEAAVAQFLLKQDEVQGVHAGDVVSAKELKDDIASLVHSGLIPKRWWVKDSTTSSSVSRVAVVVEPPELIVEYVASGGATRCRRIRLPQTFSENCPLRPVVKQLSSSHYPLLSEDAFYKHLFTLQRLCREAKEVRSAWEDSPANSPTHTAPSASAVAVAPQSQPSRSQSTPPAAKAPPPQAADLCLLYRDPEAALENVDLNGADNDTVKEFKDVMDIKFNANVVKPGDPGYEYDKRVSVKPVSRSEWDDSDDEE